MTVAFSDANRVTWFVCPGPSSGLCREFVERDLVTFQRSGRKDIVLARGVEPEAVTDPKQAKAAFDECRERLWTRMDTLETFRVENEGSDGGSPEAYKVTSPAIVHVVIPCDTKPVGHLTDLELDELTQRAFGETASEAE